MTERLAETGQQLLAAQVDAIDRFRGRKLFTERFKITNTPEENNP